MCFPLKSFSLNVLSIKIYRLSNGLDEANIFIYTLVEVWQNRNLNIIFCFLRIFGEKLNVFLAKYYCRFWPKSHFGMGDLL